MSAPSPALRRTGVVSAADPPATWDSPAPPARPADTVRSSDLTLINKPFPDQSVKGEAQAGRTPYVRAVDRAGDPSIHGAPRVRASGDLRAPSAPVGPAREPADVDGDGLADVSTVVDPGHGSDPRRHDAGGAPLWQRAAGSPIGGGDACHVRLQPS